MKGRFLASKCVSFFISCCIALLLTANSWAVELSEIKERGVIRHIGIPYANFVTGSGDGMDVELVKLFAQHLGVKYEYVPSSWGEVIGDLTGKNILRKGDDVQTIGSVPIKGDIIANGFTVIPWRKKVVDFSTHTFPTQVWLLTRADSALKPIKPSGDTEKDIAAVKALLKGHHILGTANSCLDPDLYNLSETEAKISLFEGSPNKLAPAVMNGDSEATLLDVPDALIALEKWPGKFKIIGPISQPQEMACGFDKSSVELREEFNRFLDDCERNGTFRKLVIKYYPSVFDYYPDFFTRK